MESITELLNFPQTYRQTVLNKQMMSRIIAFMPLNTIKEIAKICNINKKNVEQVLTGSHQDDLILQVTLMLFEKRFEEYYGEKPTLLTLSYLFQDNL